MDRVTRLALDARDGDRHALEAFVAATQPDVWRVCRYLGDAGDADDLTQETYLRALRSLPAYRGDGPARSWLLSIARRTVVDATRRSIRRRRVQERHEREVETTHLDQHWVELGDLLDVLEPDRREAFVLTQVLGLSYEEAADVVGCPIGTIRSRVARARQHLVGHLDEELDEGLDEGSARGS